MDRVCERIAKEYADTGKVLTLSHVFSCWTSDNIVDYSFERNYNFIDAPHFRALFPDAMIGLFENVHYLDQFPWLPPILNYIPESIIKFLQPDMGSYLQFKKVGRFVRFQSLPGIDRQTGNKRPNFGGPRELSRGRKETRYSI